MQLGGKFMAADDEVLTVKEVCDLLQVHPSTLYKMVRQGRIPSFRIGTDWRFLRGRVERWMAELTMRAQEVRRAIESGANGRVRHRPMARFRELKR
jgi:excisionase family DNA binding protein